VRKRKEREGGKKEGSEFIPRETIQRRNNSYDRKETSCFRGGAEFQPRLRQFGGGGGRKRN